MSSEKQFIASTRFTELYKVGNEYLVSICGGANVYRFSIERLNQAFKCMDEFEDEITENTKRLNNELSK